MVKFEPGSHGQKANILATRPYGHANQRFVRNNTPTDIDLFWLLAYASPTTT